MSTIKNKIYIISFALLCYFFFINVGSSNIILNSISTTATIVASIYVVVFIIGYIGIPLSILPDKYHPTTIVHITNKDALKKILQSKTLKTSKTTNCISNYFKKCVFFFGKESKFALWFNKNDNFDDVEIEIKMDGNLLNRAKFRLIDKAIFITDDIDLNTVNYSVKFTININ